MEFIVWVVYGFCIHLNFNDLFYWKWVKYSGCGASHLHAHETGQFPLKASLRIQSRRERDETFHRSENKFLSEQRRASSLMKMEFQCKVPEINDWQRFRWSEPMSWRFTLPFGWAKQLATPHRFLVWFIYLKAWHEATKFRDRRSAFPEHQMEEIKWYLTGHLIEPSIEFLPSESQPVWKIERAGKLEKRWRGKFIAELICDVNMHGDSMLDMAKYKLR